MRFTSLGKACLFLIFLTLWNAVNGNINVLYMIYSVLMGALFVSWFYVRLSTRFLKLDIQFPDQIFAGEQFPLYLTLHNHNWFPVFGVSLITGLTSTAIGDIGARGHIKTVATHMLSRRGLNDIADICLEVKFPFGLFVRRKQFPLRNILVLPHTHKIPSHILSNETLSEEVSRPKRGVGDEFLGVREFVAGDDVRLISWKLFAKTNHPLIKEYAELVGNRVTVRVSGHPPGKDTERKINEAASVARYFIDEGQEVRLITDEGDTGFGMGLLHLGLIFKHLALLGEGKLVRSTGRVPNKLTELPSINENKLMHAATIIMAATVAVSMWLLPGLDMPTKLAVGLSIPLGIIFDRANSYPFSAAFLNVLTMVVIGAVLLVDIPLEGLIPGLTHLLSYSLINRLLSRKTASDSRSIFLILFFLFVLISWQTVQFTYMAAYIVFFTASGLWLIAASEKEFYLTRRRVSAFTAIMMFVFTSAGVAFATTPRFFNPRFATLMRKLGLSNIVAPDNSIVSLANMMILGGFDDARSNTQRVMQVKIFGYAPGPGEGVHIRGGTLDHFDGKVWKRTQPDFRYNLQGLTTMSNKGRAFYEMANGLSVSPDYQQSKKSIVEEFYIYPTATSLIFSLGDPTALKSDMQVQSLYDAGGTAYFDSDYETGMHYTVLSQSDEIKFYGVINKYDEFLDSIFLQVPDDMDDVAALAREVTLQHSLPESKAIVLQQYFKNKFLYSYLGSRKKQSLEEFLFKTKAGNCEYFATAMTVMLRTLGVPSRLVIGYLTSDESKIDDYFDVRNSDSHAWVEVFIPDKGWVAYDPTPSSIEPRNSILPFGVTVYNYFIKLQMSWFRYVIGYDFYLQQRALGKIITYWRNIGIAITAAAIFAVMIAGLFFVARAHWPAFFPEKGMLPATIAYLTALKRLRRAGFDRSPWQTPREFATMVETAGPHFDILGRFTDAYYRWRFGGVGKDEMSALLYKLYAAIRHHGETKIHLRDTRLS